MDNKLKQFIKATIESTKCSLDKGAYKTVSNISSFGLIHEANGFWKITIYWKGKNVSKRLKETMIKLDYRYDTGLNALNSMIELIAEAKKEKMIIPEIIKPTKKAKNAEGKW